MESAADWSASQRSSLPAFSTATGWEPPPLPARSHGARVTFTVLMAVVPLVVSFVAGYFAATIALARIHAENYPTFAGYQDALDKGATRVADAVTAAVLVTTLAAFAFIARKVSYRWWDCLFLAIPLYGTYMYFKFLWRFAGLPDRDWPLRADEFAPDEFAPEPVVGTAGTRQ